MTMQEQIQKLVDKFNGKMEKDADMKKEIEPLTKTVNIDLGEEKYSIRLEKAHMSDVATGFIDGADIVLTTTPEYLQQLIDGDLRPMRAYVTKKVSIKGKIQDLMFLKKFL